MGILSDSRRVSYFAPASILSKPFQKNLEAETLQ